MTIPPPGTPVAFRLRRPYGNEDEFVAGDGPTITRSGMVLVGAGQRPAGMVVRFEIALRDGSALFRGEGKVVTHRGAPDEGKPPGLEIKFTRLDARGKALVDRLVRERGATAQSVPDLSPPSRSIPPLLPSITPSSFPPALDEHPDPTQVAPAVESVTDVASLPEPAAPSRSITEPPLADDPTAALPPAAAATDAGPVSELAPPTDPTPPRLIEPPGAPVPLTPLPLAMLPLAPAPPVEAPISLPAETPPPDTLAPASPVPVTAAPATLAPLTPAPATPAPVTPVPATPAPSTLSPATPLPATLPSVGAEREGALARLRARGGGGVGAPSGRDELLARLRSRRPG